MVAVHQALAMAAPSDPVVAVRGWAREGRLVVDGRRLVTSQNDAAHPN